MPGERYGPPGPFPSTPCDTTGQIYIPPDETAPPKCTPSAGESGRWPEDVLGGQHPFQGPVELGPQAVASLILAEVDGALCGPLIGCPDMEGGGVGIAQQFPCLLCHQIGVGAQGGFHPTGEFRKGGHIVLKGDGGVQHIGAVNGQQGSCILWGSGAKVEGWHGTGPPGGKCSAGILPRGGESSNGKKSFPWGLTRPARGAILSCINRGTGRVHRIPPFSASRGQCKRGRERPGGMVPGGQAQRADALVGETGQARRYHVPALVGVR